MKKYLASSALIASLSITMTLGATTNSVAQNRGGGLLLGALIGGAIVAGANQNARNNQANAAANAAASARRTENRNVQSALNYFSFDAGVADGVFGRRTRSAVSEYQVFMAFPVTGELSSYEKEFLLDSHQRAEAGGAATTNAILNNDNGTRGLLQAFLQNPLSGTGIGGGNSLGGDVQMASNLGGGAANDFGSNNAQVAAVETQPVATGLPVFVTASLEPSMDALCSTAGGVSMTKVEMEFCNLRAFAVNEGDRLATTVQGASREDIVAQCLGFAPTMASYAASASGQSSFELLDDLHGWAASTGVAPASLEGIAKVCLGVGYSSDNSELALASLLALIGLDQAGYPEMLGYHMAFGFGFGGEANKTVGAEWLETASLAFAGGEAAMNGQDGSTRAILVSAMAGQLRGIPSFGLAPTVVPASATGGFFSQSNN